MKNNEQIWKSFSRVPHNRVDSAVVLCVGSDNREG
jgi:hypothetical protein